ncbi:fibronectin type 3 and ankyrin repeat domains 1 protein isoform X3 [Esox lucius]|uniref:fibronectin type 3 and ankyrin repeat domains 1 protein isoform X3 n=1 Tax=Esox lucius TaxID=8010 RepID=UPI000576AE70|nr:fibronectin type 3 and ankyrin repeat domains 1 protein isoform X3 [Esox lucius]
MKPSWTREGPPGVGTSQPETGCLVVGLVNHHSIELSWLGLDRAPRQGLLETWTQHTLEQDDSKKHMFTTIYVFLVVPSGYGTELTVEGLEPNTTYRFRLKTTCATGETILNPAMSVTTAREPVNGKKMHQAVLMNDEEELTNILQSKSAQLPANVPDRMGYTPLMVAAMKGFSGLVQILVQHGADVNMKTSSGKNCLMLACFCGHLDIVKYLRKNGAGWCSQDGAGCSALHWAVDGAHLPVIQHMIQDGCEVDVRDGVSIWTPLMRVSAVTGEAAVAALLITAGADVNARDRDGKTPLMIAVLNNHEGLVKLLLENGADRWIKNEFGSSAMEMAKAFDRKSIVHLLEGKSSR